MASGGWAASVPYGHMPALPQQPDCVSEGGDTMMHPLALAWGIGVILVFGWMAYRAYKETIR